MKKLQGLLFLFILFITSTVYSGEYDKMNRYIDEHNIDTPIHFLIGAVAPPIIKHYLPDSMDNWKKNLIAYGSVVVFSIIDESFNKNFNIGDVSEVAMFSGISLIIFEVDF